jgi:hypothetical protein
MFILILKLMTFVQLLSVIKNVALVLIHMVVVWVPVLPLLTAALLYGYSVYYVSGIFPALAIIAIIFIGIYILMALGCLLLYYIDSCIPWRLRWIASWPFWISGLGVCFLSITYCVHVSYWLLLGALLRPDTILPFASGSSTVHSGRRPPGLPSHVYSLAIQLLSSC